MFVLWASIMHCLFTCRRRVGGYRAPAEFCEKRTIDGNFLCVQLTPLLAERRFGGSAHDKGILLTGNDRVLVREMQLALNLETSVDRSVVFGKAHEYLAWSNPHGLHDG